ncbi:hypothetical protein DMUE_3637, partial [Dictyocoela muelleri]
KKASTLIPIICTQVANGSIIWTDEHISYSSLRTLGFVHSTVCHKYEFINSVSGTNTQAVESFNNITKLFIKEQRGVYTIKRGRFLDKVCFFFNNKNNLLEKVLLLINMF